MRAVIVPTLLVAALAAVILLWFDGPRELFAYQAVLLVMGVVALRRLRSRNASEDEEVRRIKWERKPADVIPPQLEKVERVVMFGHSAALDADWRLLPLMRSIAAEQLAARHGVDLDSRPDLARRLLGEPAWRVLDPAREPPSDRRAPGLTLEDLDSAVTALEEL